MQDQQVTAAEVVRAAFETAWDKFIWVIGIGAAAQPYWLPIAENIHAAAAFLAPPLGVLLLVLQIWAKVLEIRTRR